MERTLPAQWTEVWEAPDAAAPPDDPLWWKKALAAILCLTLFAAGATIAAYRAYRGAEMRAALGEALGRDLGLTRTILEVESESSRISYREMLELCDKSLESRTDLIVELSGAYAELDPSLKSSLLEYLMLENEFMRAKREFYRRSMLEASAVEAYRETHTDRLKSKVLEAAAQVARGGDEMMGLYDRMLGEEVVLSCDARRAGVRFESVFERQAAREKAHMADTRRTAFLVAQSLNFSR